jgi:hypothetical protein
MAQDESQHLAGHFIPPFPHHMYRGGAVVPDGLIMSNSGVSWDCLYSHESRWEMIICSFYMLQ